MAINREQIMSVLKGRKDWRNLVPTKFLSTVFTCIVYIMYTVQRTTCVHTWTCQGCNNELKSEVTCMVKTLTKRSIYKKSLLFPARILKCTFSGGNNVYVKSPSWTRLIGGNNVYVKSPSWTRLIPQFDYQLLPTLSDLRSNQKVLLQHLDHQDKPWPNAYTNILCWIYQVL